MKLGVFIVGISFVGLTIGVIFITKGLIYKYVARIQSQTLIWLSVRIHFLMALIVGFFLPNNYLNQFETINNYYNENGIFILASIFIVFVISLIIIGISINLLLKIFGFKPTNIQAFENQKQAFTNFLKAKFGL